jgi:hypothetical protein
LAVPPADDKGMCYHSEIVQVAFLATRVRCGFRPTSTATG